MAPVDDPNATETRFETYYAPGLGTKYAVRSWIVSAIVAAIGIPVTWFTFVGNPQWWVLLLVGLVFAFLLFITISAAVGARGKWESDGRLAIRLDDAGLTLPRVGTLAWSEITSIRIMDTGGIHANVWLRAMESLTGSSTNRYVTVWVQDSDAVIERTGGAARAALNAIAVDGAHGFDGAWAEGLRTPNWDQTVAAVQQAAARHGITLHGRKN